MIARLRATWSRAPWLLSVFAVALALTLYFGVRMTMSAIYWADPRHTNEEIAGWMSPGYIAMSWSVPRELMIETLAREPGLGGARRLEAIATERGVPLETLVAEIEAAIQAYRDAQ